MPVKRGGGRGVAPRTRSANPARYDKRSTARSPLPVRLRPSSPIRRPYVAGLTRREGARVPPHTHNNVRVPAPSW
jgi:hypothetical protein